ncbi:hypothetical protein [Tenacibaculum sp. nBUS_03]|uniref:hypothetical protein n=1 Tax=Tenacibaculum sp. nBUS_03 TaxID=3395320 RepID=UPI003EBBE5BC
MIKKTFLIILFLLSVTAFTQNITDGYLQYSLTLKKDNPAITELHAQNENKEDSLITKGVFEASKSIKSLSFNVELNIYPDTVLIKTVDTKILFIPEKQKKHTLFYRNNKEYKRFFEITEDLKKKWNIKHTIEIDRNDKKTINGIEAYKIVITEIKQSSLGELIDVNEVYVNDKIKIPFNNYEILDLKNNIDLTGLILEIKSYDKDSPSLYNFYELKEYNLKKQDKKLLESIKKRITSTN